MNFKIILFYKSDETIPYLVMRYDRYIHQSIESDEGSVFVYYEDTLTRVYDYDYYKIFESEHELHDSWIFSKLNDVSKFAKNV